MREVGASWVDVLVVCGVRQRQRQRNVFFLLDVVFVCVAFLCLLFRVSCLVLCAVVHLVVWRSFAGAV